MAKDSDRSAGAFETAESDGLLSGLLAEENEFDRPMMWRLGSWGTAAVGAVIVAVMANQAQLGWQRDQLAAADLSRQAERLQAVSKESQNEARRLASAIETLNGDRDRLYARVTVLEQGLDSVTGAISRQSAAPPQATAKPQPADPESPAPTPQAAAPSVAPVASTPSPASDKPRAEVPKDQAGPPPQPAAALPVAAQAAATTTPPTVSPSTPLVAAKSIMAPPDPAASRLLQPETAVKSSVEATTEIATASPGKESEATEVEAPAITVQQTRFAVDLGSASSLPGLRALWRGLIKSNPELAALRPIIMIKESHTGLGLQLRLGAGPLINAAAAAKICAALTESERSCESTIFDGQRLSMRGQEGPPAEAPQGAGPKSSDKPPDGKASDKPTHRRSASKRAMQEEPQPAAATPKPEPSSTLSSFFSKR